MDTVDSLRSGGVASPISPQPEGGQPGALGQPDPWTLGTSPEMGWGGDGILACEWWSGSGPLRVVGIRRAQDVRAGPWEWGRYTQAVVVPMAAPLPYWSGIVVRNQAQQSSSQNCLEGCGAGISQRVLKGEVLTLNSVAEGWLAVKSSSSICVLLQESYVILEALRPPKYLLPWYWVWYKWYVENKDTPTVKNIFFCTPTCQYLNSCVSI